MQPLTPDQVRVYLHLLGAKRQEPTLEFLSELVAAHLQRVPFETVSKLWRKKRQGVVGIPSVDEFLAGINHFHFGGTCYSNNYYLNLLLRALDFDVRLCGADMSIPDAHMVSMVRLHGGEYLVDVGYGAPLYEPIPLVPGSKWSVQLGQWKFEMSADHTTGAWRMQQFWDGTYLHGYNAKPQPKSFEDFLPAVEFSFSPEATFMRAVMLARFSKGQAIVIRNLTVTESDAERNVERRLNGRDELCGEIERLFSIPAEIAAEAIASVPEPFGPLG